MDMTDDVEDYLYNQENPKEADEQDFLGSMAFSNHEAAEDLLSGPDPVDVNCTYTPGGLTALHMCAINNDVAGIHFLLR